MEVFREVLLWGLSWLCLFIGFRYIMRKNRKLPPGPSGWPLLGCLPLLGPMPHVTLTNLSKKYGPILYLKLGTNKMVVANTPAAAKAFLKTLDINFSNRPGNAGATYLAYNSQDMVWAPYGGRWKMLRKVCNLHMLGGKALDDWQPVRVSEMGHMRRSILARSNKSLAVNIPELLNLYAANIFGQIILSKRVFEKEGDEANEFKDMVVELMTTAGYFNIGDFIPSIAWMDLQGIQRGMKKLHKRFDAMLTRMIAEHQATAQNRKNPDFLDIVMSQRDNCDGEGGQLSDVHIKSLLLNLITAGTDTSSSLIEWTLAELISNPKLLHRAHAEMDKVIGRDRHLKESDIPNLPYLVAICKEGFRKHPSTPLSLPRVSTEACQVGGYYIPKDTRLMVNIWGIGRDPEIWNKPLEFNPDRFIGSKIDPRGNDFQLIPFGAGRRICAGTRMGITMVEYTLGSLIHAFDWEMPPGKEILNMEEAFGLALQKNEPLVVRAIPRLSLHIY
ncbi:flavonoid 3',5'-hydroxylase 1 [Cryptomeria japonica]|uniref:flavonoid 3',5'-hydroxylase 1 n=1 Tax=Cryptomeria japonica TaxID=3369 RepID=UPI0027DA6D7B|nr:flavonoid 3',5'-hydroxylase 1 [Cryptomeria japonica]